METKEYTKEEMIKWQEEEKDLPVKQRWFKHKQKDVYKRQLDIFEMQYYEEVK